MKVEELAEALLLLYSTVLSSAMHAVAALNHPALPRLPAAQD